MKRFLLILALWLSIVDGAVAQTAKPNILIITGGGTIEKEIADKMEAELSDRYNITRHYSGSVLLDGFSQIYDLRININDHDYPQAWQREAFLKFLNAAKGNSLFLLGGPMSNYNLRGVRINSFITEAGGGPVKDIQNDNPGDPEILKAPFASGPNSLTTISLGEKGGTPPLSGTGTYLSTHSDGTPGCGLYFAQNTLTNAPNGCLVVLYSFALMRDNDALRANIEHVMAAGGTLPGPTASSISLSATPNPVARNRKVTYTATVTPGATGSVMFERGNDRNLVSLNSNGTATYVGNTLSYAGTISMTAQYYGDANYNPSGKETVNVVVCGTPMYPTGVTATAGDGQATVSFTPPTSDGGAPIISYTVTASLGNITATGTSSPITVTGLTNGTAYTFKVKASNGPNTSMDSAPSNSVTPMHTSVITYPTEAPYGTAIGEGLLGATADVPGTFDYTPAKGTVLNIGNNQALTVTFTPTDKGNTTASKAVTVNVTKAPLAISEPTVTTTKEYDGSNVATITSPGEVSGIVGSDDVRVTANAQFDDANAGTGKTITVTYTLEGTNKDCYLAPAPRTLAGEIKPKEITVIPNPLQKIYGDDDPYISYTLDPSYSYSQITGLLSRAKGEDVGSHLITMGDLQPTSSNYKFTLADGYFKIVPKRLYLISPPFISKVYDGTTKVTTPPSVGGIIPGDDASVAVTANYYDKNVGTGRTVIISLAISGKHAGNYTLPVASPIYSAIITPASLTVTPNNIDKRVEQAYSFAGTEFITSGLLEGDELTSVTLTSDGAAALAAVGTYSIAASSAQGKDANNYNITYSTGTLNVIDKITPTISWAEPASITYGTALGTAQLNATADAEGIFTYTPAAGTVFNVGQGQMLSVTFTPNDRENYKVVTKTLTITVAKAPLTVTAGSYTIAKGEAIPALSFSYSGFVNGEDESVLDTKPSATTTATVTSVMGDYATVAAGGMDSNYEFIYVNGTLTIGKAIPTISWNVPVEITYGTAVGAAQLNATADVEGTFTYNPAAGVVLNAGDGQVLSVTFTPADAVNYAEVSKTVALSVNKAPLTVTASSYTITKGEAIPSLGVSYSGFVNGEDESVLDVKPIATTTATAASAAGTYDVNVADGSDNNYAFTYVAGTLTISPATGIDDIVGAGVAVYPNPFTDNLTITVDGDCNGRYTVTSLVGATVEQGVVEGGKATTSLSHLKQGVYMLRINTNGKVQTIMVVKQ